MSEGPSFNLARLHEIVEGKRELMSHWRQIPKICQYIMTLRLYRRGLELSSASLREAEHEAASGFESNEGLRGDTLDYELDLFAQRKRSIQYAFRSIICLASET